MSRAVALRRIKSFSVNGTGVLVALVTLFPIAWMVSTAFKPSHEIFSLTPQLTPTHPTLGNFSTVISGQASGIGSVWLFFRNSLGVTLATVLVASVRLAARVGRRRQVPVQVPRVVAGHAADRADDPGSGPDHRAVP